MLAGIKIIIIIIIIILFYQILTYHPLNLDKTEILLEFSPSIYKADKSSPIAIDIQSRQEQLYNGCRTGQTIAAV